MGLVNMKSTKDDTLLGGEVASDSKGPEFPWGLKLNLDKESLAKLGITELPELGKTMKLVAVVEVVDRNEHEDEHGLRRDMGLQITSMALEVESEEQDAGEKLFGPSRPEPRGPQITDIGDF